MVRILLLSCLLFFCAFLQAQDRYYLSLSDFREGKAVMLDSVYREGIPVSTQLWNGSSGCRFKTGKGKTDRILGKYALLEVCKDTLYVNTYGLRHEGYFAFYKGYAPGFCYGRDRVGFISPIRLEKGKPSTGERIAAASGAAFGLVGGMIAAGALAASKDSSLTGLDRDRTCYFLGMSAEDEKEVFQVTSEYMQELMADNPELLQSYLQEDASRREGASVNLLYLDKLQGVRTCLSTSGNAGTEAGTKAGNPNPLSSSSSSVQTPVPDSLQGPVQEPLPEDPE